MWAVTAAQLAANTVLANSMHSLYGLIQTLQVVTHHQGANTPFPANAKALNGAIQRITQLDVVPPEIVKHFKFWRYFEPIEARQEDEDDAEKQADAGKSVKKGSKASAVGLGEAESSTSTTKGSPRRLGLEEGIAKRASTEK